MTSLTQSSTLARYRFHWAEPLFWIAAAAFFFVYPQYLAVGTTVLVMALFAVSYDLIIGIAGVLTLGHGLYFGIGAYSAALIAKFAWSEAITGAIAAGAISAVTAGVLGRFVLQLRHLPLIMVTLGISVIFFEAGNKAAWLTGGDDGLSGFALAPLLGTFRWSIFGHTKYLYALAWLFVIFYLLRCVVASPFGVALQGIRENRDRMNVIGAPVLRHLTVAYVIAAGVAGIAGAVLAQTNALVGLHVLALDITLDGLVIVVLGGIGTLYGALVGAPVYLLVKYFAQQWNPFYWMFVIGALLIIVVRFGRGGLLGLAGDAMVAARGFTKLGRAQR